jgi:predicted AlkP superfamily pyrophosphatase or phosphodiesterase
MRVMSGQYDMRSLAPTVCKILGVRSPGSAEAVPFLEMVDSMGEMERLVVVVIDAFGVSTWVAARSKTPTFNALANRHLVHVWSVMPTITPVNFATMLTGAGSDEHGIRDRTEKLTLETVFDVLKEVGMNSATAARAKSSLGILISPFADYPGIAHSNTDKEVTSLACKSLRKSVNLLWVQLLDVDDTGHAYGPLSSEGIAATSQADANLKKIASEASENGYGIIVLADHGQHTVENEEGYTEGTHGTIMKEDRYIPVIWATPGEIKLALDLTSVG